MELKFLKMFRNGINGYDTIKFINDKNVVYQIPIKQSVKVNEDYFSGKIVRVDNVFTPIEKELQIVK